MTWLKVSKYMYSHVYHMYMYTTIDIGPFLDLNIGVGLIFLYNNQEAVREITV